MATHSFIRLRLFFDYPPPAVVGCRMCWLLVDLNSCRVVADLESIIREKFEFSRGSILSLFVEDCYLPHTESIYVVRDNDSVRVTVDCLNQVNGHSSFSDTAADTCRKRPRDTGEDGSEGESLSAQCKKKKKKKRFEENSAEGSCLITAANEKSQGKKHKKKKKTKTAANSHASTPKPAAANNNKSLCVSKTNKKAKNTTTASTKKQNAPSSETSVSSSEDKKAPGKKTAKASSSASKKNPKPTQPPARTPSSSSSETDSSSDEAVKVPPKPNPLTLSTQSTNSSLKPLTGPIRAPADTLAEPRHRSNSQLVIGHQQPAQSLAGRSSGKDGFLAGTDHGDRLKAESSIRGESCFESSCRDAKEPSYQTDSLTNVSVVLQNEAENVPQKDYSSMPLLAAPPQVGQTIAFKLLELTENYTPEISEYKEGKIISFDPTTKQIELELLNVSQAAPVEPGKFDLVYQNPDGSERVEYAVPRGSWVTEHWESLLEPRLII